MGEETRLEIQDHRLAGLYSDPTFQIVTYPDGQRVHFVTSLFDATVFGGTLCGSSEGLDWRWFLLDQLPSELLPYACLWLRDVLDGRGEVLIR